jgi:hypothetical protein
MEKSTKNGSSSKREKDPNLKPYIPPSLELPPKRPIDMNDYELEAESESGMSDPFAKKRRRVRIWKKKIR